MVFLRMVHLVLPRSQVVLESSNSGRSILGLQKVTVIKRLLLPVLLPMIFVPWLLFGDTEKLIHISNLKLLKWLILLDKTSELPPSHSISPLNHENSHLQLSCKFEDKHKGFRLCKLGRHVSPKLCSFYIFNHIF